MIHFITLSNLVTLCVLLGVLICLLCYRLLRLQRLIIQYRKELLTIKSTLSNVQQFQSHRVRGPLTNILAITDLLTSEPGMLSKEETRALFKDLKTSTKELDHIIGDIVIQTQTYHRW